MPFRNRQLIVKVIVTDVLLENKEIRVWESVPVLADNPR